MTRVSSSGGMIIQHFDFKISNRGQTVYKGTTNFGSFSKASLAQQVGVREANCYQPGRDEQIRGRSFDYPSEPPFPNRGLRLIDRIDLYVPDGGPHGLGFIVGSRMHGSWRLVFQGSFLPRPGLPRIAGPGFVFAALKNAWPPSRWGAVGECHFDMISEKPHRWIYRGQVIPQQQTGDGPGDNHSHRRSAAATLTADGFLSVDGLVIYQMNDFTLRMRTGY